MREIITILSAIVLGVTLITLIFSLIVYILFRLKINKRENLKSEITKETEEEVFIRYQPKGDEKI
ncbi:MAG: hypothetical protein N2323_01480 [candidate division WOR-3 bacterium]|nr:hypothetical protein [candidate division WOR-3 bacterium]MCX7836617.1 hypothetical protein [candidate division WOR-3 bacterium]MDW8113335.1 hypothetical protein [candidate division WOR-3 bacterium]